MDVYGHLDTDSIKAIAMKFEILLDSKIDVEGNTSQKKKLGTKKPPKSSVKKAS